MLIESVLTSVSSGKRYIHERHDVFGTQSRVLVVCHLVAVSVTRGTVYEFIYVYYVSLTTPVLFVGLEHMP